MVAAADQLAAVRRHQHAGPGRFGAPTPPSPPAPPWRSWARTCAGSAATCWPWSRPRRVAARGAARHRPGRLRVRPGPHARARALTTMPLRGDIRSVQVPGAVDGWLALHERYGRLSLGEVLAPAIELAEDGFPASIMLALASHLVHALPGAGELCPDGPLAIGQTVRVPGHRPHAARHRPGGTRRLLRRRVRPRPARAGCRPLRARRLRDQRGRCGARPCRHTAWGHGLWTVPPPSQGYLTLAGAAVAEAAGLGADPDDPQWAHLLVETWRAVGHDRPAVLFDGADGGALLDPARLAAAAARVDAGQAGAARRGAGTRHGRSRCRRGPPGRRRHHAPLRHRRGRARRVAHPVERARLRLPPGRAPHRRLPAQPRRGLLARAPGTRPRWRPAGDPRTPSRPCSSPPATGESDAPGGCHGRRRPATDPRAAAGPPAARPATTRPRAISAPRLTLDAPSAGTLPPLVGRGPDRGGRGGRAPGLAGRTGRPGAPGADHQRLRPRRRGLRPDHRHRARRRRERGAW